jgi:hypothetical protein
MHWRIKLTNGDGVYWLTDLERMWSDDPKDALQFLCEDTADKAKKLAESRFGVAAGHGRPRIKVIKFVTIIG